MQVVRLCETNLPANILIDEGEVLLEGFVDLRQQIPGISDLQAAPVGEYISEPEGEEAIMEPVESEPAFFGVSFGDGDLLVHEAE